MARTRVGALDVGQVDVAKRCWAVTGWRGCPAFWLDSGAVTEWFEGNMD